MEYESQSTPLRHFADDDKPREKALANGIKSLSDAELMAIIFGTGLRGKNVLDLSREILYSVENHLSDLAKMTPRQICDKFDGIGPAKAISLLAALELGTRSARDALLRKLKKITTSEDAVSIMRKRFQGLDHEEFWIAMLNNSCGFITDYRLAAGGQTATVVDIKLLYRAVLECRATAIIVFHNHPSGTLTPSMQDDSLTKRIKEAGKLLDVRVLDHIIITDGGFYSYQDQGRL